jgi:hypothetical protein
LYYDALNTSRPAEGIDLTHRPRNAAERFHSRYLHEPNSPLFPFGYGLSYTRFTYSPLTLSTKTRSARAYALEAGVGAGLVEHPQGAPLQQDALAKARAAYQDFLTLFLCFQFTVVFPSWTSRARSPSPAPSLQR